MFQRDVAKGIHRVENVATNWYLVEEDDRLTIVDAGVPRSWNAFLEALRELERDVSDVEAIILTHAHFDHTGFAERARAELGIPVYVHEDDVPLTKKPWQYAHERHPLRYAKNPSALSVFGSFLVNRAFWPAPIRQVERFDESGTLSVPGSPKIVYSPGHTLGHCAFHFEDRDTLIAGDAIVTLDPYTGRTGPRLAARAAAADSERAFDSLDALAQTGATTILTGHGEPWREGAEAAVQHAREAGIS